MCGIAGFIDKKLLSSNYGSEGDIKSIAIKMGNAIMHRGPDSYGDWIDTEKGIVFVFRRLSILDLSVEGHQPMMSHNKRFVVVFNGEIYNHLALRSALEKNQGSIAWKGHSDTETLLECIAHWGLNKALQSFNGMFAFALYDRQEQLLHLCRDRLGKKPLYYGWVGGVFLFGSELKALKAHPVCQKNTLQINQEAFQLFIQYAYVPTPFSIYQGIFKLEPGSILTFSNKHIADKTLPSCEYYWQAQSIALNGQQNQFKTSSEDTLVENLRDLLRDAVSLRMHADVPLGAFLSGGVDSSLIVALMQEVHSQPIKTFSIGFNEAAFNEADYAKAVASHLGTDHTELYVTPQEALNVIPDLSDMYDEPFADSSQIPTFLVSKLARQQVTVALSGDGGDELFGGYNRYLYLERLFKKISIISYSTQKFLSSSFKSVFPYLSSLNNIFLKNRKFDLELILDRYSKIALTLPIENKEMLYLKMISWSTNPELILKYFSKINFSLNTPQSWPIFQKFQETMMYLDLRHYLLDDILVKVDRASMATSLEVRNPLLDHRIIEFAWRLPLSLKIQGATTKKILRSLLYTYVPKHLIERPKMGFGVPIGTWLRGPLKDWAENLLSEHRLQSEGFFQPEVIRKHWLQHLNGKVNCQQVLWPTLVFQSWLEKNYK